MSTSTTPFESLGVVMSTITTPFESLWVVMSTITTPFKSHEVVMNTIVGHVPKKEISQRGEGSRPTRRCLPIYYQAWSSPSKLLTPSFQVHAAGVSQISV